MGECFMFGRGTLEPFDPVFANNSWETIILACRLNKVPAAWRVADQKTMTIDGHEYHIDIIGKQHDDYADGSGKAPLTLQMHECFAADWEYSLSPMSMSGGVVAAGWHQSYMRTTVAPAALAVMPVTVQSAIREVNKLTAEKPLNANIITTADKLFLPSEVELTGSAGYSIQGEGTRYPYYETYGSFAKPRLGETGAPDWWLRSPAKQYLTSNVYAFGYNGTGVYSYDNELRVSFAFCF